MLFWKLICSEEWNVAAMRKKPVKIIIKATRAAIDNKIRWLIGGDDDKETFDDDDVALIKLVADGEDDNDEAEADAVDRWEIVLLLLFWCGSEKRWILLMIFFLVVFCYFVFLCVYFIKYFLDDFFFIFQRALHREFYCERFKTIWWWAE